MKFTSPIPECPLQLNMGVRRPPSNKTQRAMPLHYSRANASTLVGLALLAGCTHLSRKPAPAPPTDVPRAELNLAPNPQALLDSARALMVADTNVALVTMDEAGQPRVRTVRAFLDPVDPTRPTSGATVWVMTRRSTRKVAQVRANPRVTLYFNEDDATRYVSIMGDAIVHTDPEHPGAKRHYDAAYAQYFWPQFPKDFVMLEIRPRWLEYMSPGMRPAQGSWRPQAVVFAR